MGQREREVLQKQQAGPMDFLNSMMGMVMPPNGEGQGGGPAGMFGGMFMGIVNQTQSMLGPILGMGAGADGRTLFAQITQQVMGMFNQMTGMWSGMVNSQLSSWEQVMPGNMNPSESEVGEQKNFVLLKESSDKLRKADTEVNEIIRARRQVLYKRKASMMGEENTEKRTKFDDMVAEHFKSIKETMESVMKNIQTVHSSNNWSGDAMNFSSTPFFEELDKLEPMKEMDMEKILLEVQKEMSNLWQTLSKEIEGQMFTTVDEDVPDEGAGISRLTIPAEREMALKESARRMVALQSNANLVVTRFQAEAQNSKGTPSAAGLQRFRDSLREYIVTGSKQMRDNKEAMITSVQNSMNQNADGVRASIRDFKDRMSKMLENNERN